MSGASQAIVLAGGGAFGAYALGVMEALFSGRCRHCQDREAAIWSGTSVGAFSAAIMASRWQESCLEAVRHLRTLWLERIAEMPGHYHNGVYRLRGDPWGYFSHAGRHRTRLGALLEGLPHDLTVLTRSWLARGLDLAASGESVARRYLRLLDLRNFLSSTPLRQLIADTVDPRRLLDPRARTLKLVATQWDTGETVVFRNRMDRTPRDSTIASYRRIELDEENTRPAIRASAAIPGLFAKVRIGDENYVDGGLTMNAPLHPAIAAGASLIHLIHFEPRLRRIPLGRAPSAIEDLDRILNLVPANLVNADLRIARRKKRLIAVAKAVADHLGNGTEQGSEADELLRSFVRDFADQEISVHRYFPRRNFGGMLGVLDFRRRRLIELIEAGFEDAVEHDCEASGCVL